MYGAAGTHARSLRHGLKPFVDHWVESRYLDPYAFPPSLQAAARAGTLQTDINADSLREAACECMSECFYLTWVLSKLGTFGEGVCDALVGDLRTIVGLSYAGAFVDHSMHPGICGRSSQQRGRVE